VHPSFANLPTQREAAVRLHPPTPDPRTGVRIASPQELAITAVFTATEYSLIWRMLDLLGFPALALYLILGKTAVSRLSTTCCRRSQWGNICRACFSPSLLPFDQGIENHQQLASTGNQGNLFGFACGEQALIKLCDHRIVLIHHTTMR